MKIYVDITQYINNRLNTGIQRVVKEFLKRAIKDKLKLTVLCYDDARQTFYSLEHLEVISFLDDIKNYSFKVLNKIDILSNTKENKIFFDIDSVWNSSFQREKLYPHLKKANFKIYNFIYDLIPVLFPKLMYAQTKENFLPYLLSIFEYSDFIFFDSINTQLDFYNFQKSQNSDRLIKSKVVYLGSNFKTKKMKIRNPNHQNIFEKKYILFVGTIEPRKQQFFLYETFKKLYKKYPDLNIVFIGRIGWGQEEFIQKLYNDPLKDKNIFHFENIEDGDLVFFYKNAFLVTYLSLYEGYGLPIAESLKYGKITIASNNSSIPEVGKNFVDYVFKPSDLNKIINFYIKNPKKYIKRTKEIQKNYVSYKWKHFYESISSKLILNKLKS